ncbi:MAG: response regulator [Bacteroidales bacterium]|nr:response regulator [Bacteroidales bacterium]
MRTSSKLLLIQVFFIVGLILILLGWNVYNSRQTEIFLKSTLIHNEKTVVQALETFKDGFLRPLNDNSEWLETYKYIENPYRSFEEENINTLLQTFSISAIYVYDSKGKSCYHTNDSTYNEFETLLTDISIPELLTQKKPKCHFFLQKNGNLFEVFGATVVPTFDNLHVSVPKGYLFFVKFWDSSVIRHMEILTSSEFETNFSKENSKDAINSATTIFKNLKDWKGDHVAWISFLKKDPLVEEWKKSSSMLSYINAGLGIIFVLIISLIFRNWVSKPLLNTIKNLHHSEERFRQVAENAGEWIWEIDRDGLYTYSSHSVEKILGYKVEDLVGKKYFYELFTKEMREQKEAILESLRKGEIFSDFVNPNLHKNGNTVILQTSCVPFRNSKGEIIGYRGTDLDITDHQKVMEDLKKALNKAEENDRLKTAFLNNISHEIRTPMHAIIGYSGLLNEVGNNQEKQKAFTDIICTASNQLLSIIEDIINISTLEAGQEVLRIETMELNSVLRNLRNQFQLKATAKGIGFELYTHLSDQDATIRTDNVKFVQVVSNLLINAFKFTRDGHVEFGYKLNNNKLQFFVEDTGIGIPEHMQTAIFDRFRQADSSVAREYGGTGLGLSISKAYVELMGGKIWLRSVVGKGTTFYFELPYNPAYDSDEPAKPSTFGDLLSVSSSKAILVAEDQELNFLLIREMVSWMGWNLIRAENGEEAVTICRENPNIDLVLMDLKMPVMDGFTATKIIKSFRPDLPVIIQSAYIHEEDKEKAQQYGCDDYITKPFEKDSFVALVRKYLAN